MNGDDRQHTAYEQLAMDGLLAISSNPGMHE